MTEELVVPEELTPEVTPEVEPEATPEIPAETPPEPEWEPDWKFKALDNEHEIPEDLRGMVNHFDWCTLRL